MNEFPASSTDPLPKEKSPAFFLQKILWLLVFLFALALRLIELGHQNLWCDEVATIQVSHEKGRALIDAMSTESNKPPLYFFFMHYWLSGGTSEFWARLPSALFGAMACLVTLILGRERFGIKIGWLSGVILAVLPFHVYYSQETRMYALLTLTGAAAMLFTFRFCQTQQLRHALLYLLFATISCYVFTYGIFLLPFSCLVGLIYRPQLPRKSLFLIWMINVLALMLFLPWVPRLLHSVQTGEGLHSLMRGSALQTSGYAFFALGLGTTFGPTIHQLRAFGRHIFGESPAVGILLVVGLLTVTVAVIAGLRKLWQTNRNAFFFALLGLAIFLGMPCLANLLKPGIPNNPRYNILAIIPLAVALTGFAQWVLERGAIRKVVAIIFGVCVGVSLANNFFNPRYAREDIRAAARFAETQDPPARNLFISTDFMVVTWRHYYEGSVPVFPLTVPGRPVDEALKPFATPLNAGRFDLIYTRPDYGDPQGTMLAWFKQHYRLQLEKDWTGVSVYVFDGPDSSAVNHQVFPLVAGQVPSRLPQMAN
jgi:hypothetical protein